MEFYQAWTVGTKLYLKEHGYIAKVIETNGIFVKIAIERPGHQMAYASNRQHNFQAQGWTCLQQPDEI
jgi:hypothetical protein